MVKVLAVNAGSSTLKWKLFEMPEEIELADGLIDRLGQPKSNVKVKYGDGQKFTDDRPIENHQEAVASLMTQLKDLGLVTHLHEIVGIGHRVVAGGEQFNRSVVVDDHVLLEIKNLRDYAPLHNPIEATYIDIFREAMPWALEVAVFDTAFHQSMPAENFLYSLPYQYYQQYGARKYGAHGTSVRYVVRRAAEMLNKPLEDLRLVVMHLGSGSSVTAVQNGKSVDTSMGFTPLAGVTMGTRSGDVDPSLIAYLMNKLEITDVNEMIHILNNESGLMGISELSPDQRDLENVEDTNEQAALALNIFANRVFKYVGSYAALMNGIDGLIFTGGVGENGAEMRAKIMAHLSYLGATIDPEANQVRGKETDLSAADATVKTLLIPTNEELMIVRDVMALKAE
ncbi:acetate/propionate family kinase [Lacticaseibacillus saniviri]|uniref:Acetate kinase n=2 Tax=Lacticaseibacillus saniviri TaxID=931533 RepID=A0A0R2MRP8_9LACO|nr:acetate kinase [Lacticaseibacillus saniviri]KRO16264.1 acetate kinase A propionate kinase 2 [Lacticaseibacillus saniviri JCM 17471 = DSM 24301]